MMSRRSVKTTSYKRLGPVGSQVVAKPEKSDRSLPLRMLMYLFDGLNYGRTIVLNFLLVAVTVAVVWMTYHEATARVVVINAFLVPDAISKRGYSPEAVVNRIAGRLREIDAQSETGMRRDGLSIPSSQVNIQIPGAGLDYRAFLRFTKEVFGIRDTSVSGDVLDMGSELAMRVVVSHPAGVEKVLHVTGKSTDIEGLLISAADQIQQEVNPYVLTAYLSSREEKRCNKSPPCNYDPSIRLFKEILQQGNLEDSKWALLGWAYVLIQQEKYVLAAEKAEQAVSIDEGFSAAWNSWGRALSLQGKSQESIEKYRQALKYNSGYALALRNWGDELVELKEYEQAVKKFSLATVADPNDATAFEHWSVALDLRGSKEDQEEALKLLQHAAALEPRSSSRANKVGLNLLALKRYDPAINMFRHASDLDPGNIFPLQNWAKALYEAGRTEDAIEKYRRVTEIFPEKSFAFAKMGEILGKLKRHEEAVKAYERAAALEPDSLVVVFNWGRELSMLRKYKEAAAKFQRASEIDPKDADSFDYWGFVLDSQGLHAQAAKKFGIAVRLNPQHATAQEGWGIALSKLGRYREAIEKFSLAAQYNPKEASIFSNWGSSLRKLNERAAAGEKYREAVRLGLNGTDLIVACTYLREDSQELPKSCP